MTAIKFNLQQQPKTSGYLSNFIQRPGFVLIQADLSSVEPRVIAEFSKDKTLLSLYGNNAKPNDVYLYNAAHIELFRDEIRKVYDPYNPTPDSINLAKKQCKKIRQFNKAVTLACGYSAGVKKIQNMLIMMGFPVTVQEAKIIHRDYWRLYAGIKAFQEELTDVWHATGGWIPSALGKPICVPFDYLSDIVNRFAQTSGHEILMRLVYEIDQLRTERGVEMYPWIPDFHDETIWEVPERNVEAALDIFRTAEQRLNDYLQMEVKMEAEPQVAECLAEIKCEDYYEWKSLQSSLAGPTD